MIWIVLALIGIGIGIAIMRDSKGSSDDVGPTLFMLALSFVIAIIPIASGASCYPWLIAEKARVVSLKEEIETLRGAHYGDVEGGVFVGGSLDNLQQSKELSIYIKEYATLKAQYNAQLASDKVKKQTAFYIWFGGSGFASKKILELKKL